MIENKEYPRNTIGFHRQNAEKLYGEGSGPVLWLDEQAEKTTNGYDEKANMTEQQVIQHLRKLHENEKEDDFDEDEESVDFDEFDN